MTLALKLAKPIFWIGICRYSLHIGVYNMKLITCHLPEAYLDGIEELVSAKVFPNRSEAIRVAVRELLKSELTHKMVKEPKTAQPPRAN